MNSINNISNPVIICVPLYKKFSDLLKSELLSLNQLKRVLFRHPIVAIAPEFWNEAGYYDFFDGLDFKIQRFDNMYFESQKAYNMLCLSIELYERFSNYQHMLIYQTDAYVFKDEIDYWVNKDYDFIGAPWLRSVDDKIKSDIVGNGGFSMRKTASCLRLLKKIKKYSGINSVLKPMSIFIFYKKINSILDAINPSMVKDIVENRFNEDFFFGVLSKKIDGDFKVADFFSALKFSFEWNPDIAYDLNNELLPFGCHAWEYNNPSFWEKFIETR